MLLSFFIIALCTVFVYPIMYFVPYYNDSSVYLDLYYSSSMLMMFLWLFIVPFVTKDFSSKYTKNLFANYSLSDRIFYVLSKFVYIIAFSVLIMLLQFVVMIIFNYTMGEHCMYKVATEFSEGDRFTIGEFYLRYFVWTLNCIEIGRASCRERVSASV